MSRQHAWGWKVAAYLFASGAGAGAYAVGALAQPLGREWTAVASVGLPLGPLLVGPATLFLIWDLGRPSGFARAARRPGSSWISRGVVILTVFLVVSVAHVGLTALGAAPGRGPALAVTVAGVLAALATMVYTGLLLGAVRPIPFWSTPILPLLFVASSLSTGVMAVDLGLTLGAAAGAVASVPAALRAVDLGLLALEAGVIALYLSLAHATVAARAATALLTTGALATRFWGAVVVAGIVVPFAIQLSALTGSAEGPALLSVVSSVSGLLGGLLLRHVVIAAGTKSPLSAAGMLVALPGRSSL